MAVKVIWGDRLHEAAVDDECIIISEGSRETIVLSHAEMRELVLSWERHETMEAEK